MAADLKTFLPELIKKIEERVPYAAALVKKSSGIQVNVNRVQESIDPEDPAEGLVLTLWNGQSFFEYSTDQIEFDSLEKTALSLASHALAQIDPSLPKSDIDPGPKLEKEFTRPLQRNPDEIPLQEKLSLARRHRDEALAVDPLMVVNAISMVADRTHSDLFVNRNKIISQSITRTDAMLMVFVSKEGKTTEIYDGLSKNNDFSAVQLSSESIRALVEDGKKLLTAERLVPGIYDVVTDQEWSGIIAHECFGHGMETDLYVRERALSQHYIGKPVASPIVNMSDDPSMLEESGGFFFDDEGQLTSPTPIIRKGILERGLTDLASAHKLHLTRSANGRRESFERKAYARMTNTFFENGTHTKDEIIGSVKNGLYLRYATNGMEDPQAWGIQVEGLWAEEINEGKLTGKVYSPVIMTGFVPELLQSIEKVGNDRWISGLGMCGKGHKEWVKNTTGGPHLKMRARLA